MDRGKIVRFIVTEKEHQMTLLSFLKVHCTDAPSVKKMKKAIDAKCCKVNGRVETFSSFVLARGDVVQFTAKFFAEKQEVAIIPLFEDEDLLICNKPCGLVSDSVLFRKMLHREKDFLELVHRLDKDTTGVIVLAKTAFMQEEMKKLFSQRKVHKYYLALVEGSPRAKEGVIDSLLEKKKEYHGQTIYGSGNTGHRALTYWKRLSTGKGASLTLCEPVTGRTHQIRVHMKELGHPVLGDHQYGSKSPCPIEPGRHLLHAYGVVFTHPKTQQEMRVVAPIPADFMQIAGFFNVCLRALFSLVFSQKEEKG